MTKWFTPTADNFFSRVPKSRMVQALTEAGKPPSAKALNLMKAELATFAESEIKGSGWVPEPVRISEVTIDEPCLTPSIRQTIRR